MRRRAENGDMASRPKRRAVCGGVLVPREQAEEEDEVEDEDEDDEDSEEEEDEDEIVDEVRSTRDLSLVYMWEKAFWQPEPGERVSCLERRLPCS